MTCWGQAFQFFCPFPLVRERWWIRGREVLASCPMLALIQRDSTRPGRIWKKVKSREGTRPASQASPVTTGGAGAGRGGRSTQGRDLRSGSKGLCEEQRAEMGQLTLYTIVSVWCLPSTDSRPHGFLPGDWVHLKSLPDLRVHGSGVTNVVWLKKL